MYVVYSEDVAGERVIIMMRFSWSFPHKIPIPDREGEVRGRWEELSHSQEPRGNKICHPQTQISYTTIINVTVRSEKPPS